MSPRERILSSSNPLNLLFNMPRKFLEESNVEAEEEMTTAFWLQMAQIAVMVKKRTARLIAAREKRKYQQRLRWST